MPTSTLSRKSIVLALLGLGWVTACAAVLGIEDGVPRDDAGGGDASLPVIGDGTITTDDASGTTCELITLHDELGVFVTVDGTDTPSCGTRAAPCKSVGAAIARAGSLARPGVYIAAGTYVETVTLRTGIDLIGGWNVLGSGDAAEWSRACSSRVTTLKAATEPVTVRAPSLAGQVTKLSTLTIASRDGAPSPGESPVGILASGGTTLQLVAVDVRVGNAGAGVTGGAGDAGAPGATNCTIGGDGGPGAPPSPKGTGADAGYFTTQGYVATAGGTGAGGPPGNNGSAPGKGTCVDCRDCQPNGTVCGNVDLGPSCGTDGKAGCGGVGGAGGVGGTGGGSSVALLAWDGAQVSVVGGSLTAGDGAGGAPGALGGEGGPGGAGSAGAGTAACDVACGGILITACPTAHDAGRGGATGGNGGKGASGGPGGDGAGGNSYAIVQGGDANVVADPSTVLAFGNAGAAGGPGASAGHAAARGP